MEFFLGHCVGDYLLQNNWMAQNKKKQFLPCFVHCLLYTLAVCTFTGWWQGWLPMLVFLSHYIIDRTNICMWWMAFTGKTILRDGDMITTEKLFFPLVYVGVDNTCHLVLLWLIAKFVVKGA